MVVIFPLAVTSYSLHVEVLVECLGEFVDLLTGLATPPILLVTLQCSLGHLPAPYDHAGTGHLLLLLTLLVLTSLLATPLFLLALLGRLLRLFCRSCDMKERSHDSSIEISSCY